MDEDDQSAALQHQAELEQRMLRDDPDYERWLEQVEKDYAIQ